MKTWFYDDELETNKDDPEFLNIARMYRFDIDKFSEDDERNLTKYLEDLPTGMNVSAEYPWGLQVYGMTLEENWSAWSAAFEEKAQHLPHFEVDTDDAVFQPENKDRPVRLKD